MKSVKTYFSGLRGTTAFWRPMLFIYLVNLILGLSIVMPFIGRLQAEFGGSVLPEAFMSGYDHTALSEFLRQSMATVSGMLGQFAWILGGYLLLNVFFTGGILELHKNREDYRVRAFWNGGGLYFFRFLRLTVAMVLLHAFSLLIVYFPLMVVLKKASERVTSESSLLFITLGGISIHLLILVFLQLAARYARIQMVVGESRRALASLFGAQKFVLRHLLSTYTLYGMLLINTVLILLLYFFLNRLFAPTDGGVSLIVLILQQLVVFCRVFLGIWSQCSQFNLYGEHHSAQTAVSL